MQIFDFQSNYDFYQSYHGNVVNKLIHILCIPAIVWSTIILLSDYKFRGNNVSALLLLFYSGYYFILNPTLAMVAVPLLFYCFFHALNFKWEYPDYKWRVWLVFISACNGTIICGKRSHIINNIIYLYIIDVDKL